MHPTPASPAATEALSATPEGGVASTLGSLVGAAEESVRKLSAVLARTEQARSELAEAAASLEQHLRRGDQLLSALRVGTDEARSAGPSEPEPAERRAGGGPGRPDAAALKSQLMHLTAEAESLEAARAVAEAADRAKSCFLAAMSRELRTPVDGLARMIELLQQTDLDQEQKRYLHTANYSVSALLSLLDSVLSVSKLDAGVPELRSTDFDLRQTLDRTVESVVPAARQKGLRLTCHIPPEVPALVRGEPGRLRLVTVYAIHRAIQLAQQGEIAVRAAVEKTTPNATTIRFTVHHADTEVSAEEIERAFATHAQIDGAPLDGTGGTGLGLAIARQLVELMGGRIGIDANTPKGFTIWFVLPLDNYLKPADDRREHGRLPQELLQSSIGPVLNLSMGGMRVQCSKPPKGRIDVELLDLEEPVKLQADVMWVRRLGFRKFEVGLNFPSVPAATAKQLTRISLNHRLRRLLGIG